MKKNRIGKKCNEGSKIKKKLSSNNISAVPVVPVVNPDNEIRRAKKAAQKKAAKKKSNKLFYKNIPETKVFRNMIPEYNEIMMVYSLNSHTSSDVWDQYNKILEGGEGKLIVKLDNGDESIVTRFCKGFSKIEPAIWKCIEGIPMSWSYDWDSITEDKKAVYRDRYNKGDYIYNRYRNDKSPYQWGLSDNIIFWYLEDHGVTDFEPGHMEEECREFMVMYHEAFVDSSIGIDETIYQWWHLQEYTGSEHTKVCSKGLGALYAAAQMIGVGNCLSFLSGIHYKMLDKICEVILHIRQEDRVIFLLSIMNKAISKLDVDIAYDMFLSSDWITDDRLISYRAVISEIKHEKWLYSTGLSHSEHPFVKKDWMFEQSSDIQLLVNNFTNKFGRVPKIINTIYAFKVINSIDDKAVVDRFNVKSVSRLLKTYNEYNTLYIQYLHPELEGVSDNVLQYLRRATDNVIAWVVTHKKSNDDFLIEVIKNFDYLSTLIDINSANVREIKRALVDCKGNLEFERIRRIYKFSTLSSSIQLCEVYNGEQKAFVLDANSPLQAVLGYETHCCQHLEGAGESAMMYGLLAPNGGFWAIEEKSQIVAQAEIWEGFLENKRVLVFDNIELANDRDFELIRKTLEKWLESSCYKDVIMGTGYNVLAHGYKTVEGNLVQPECEAVPYPYTDTGVCVWLKKEGEVQYV